MPVKRRRAKGKPLRITPTAIEAYKARDYLELHRALGLFPWEMSPIPARYDALGCDPDWVMPEQTHNLFELSFQQALELQHELEAACK
ncbi:hypothetical protein [Mesorhizobium sp. LNJC405B00]|uniref:hypothetical protein n=1 Tax=unclassified Mesorhizobium TaxID=325217 RepID=UPI0003CF7855|nr:hypothetical protein [Mesorhizobium sp. LNJC405B00]ESX98737.1 hypothetical protein X755_15615 [Mesorhizobium sp. LNJC405B00]